MGKMVYKTYRNRKGEEWKVWTRGKGKEGSVRMYDKNGKFVGKNLVPAEPFFSKYLKKYGFKSKVSSEFQKEAREHPSFSKKQIRQIVKDHIAIRKAKHPDFKQSGYEVYYKKSGHVPEVAMGEKNWFATKKYAKKYKREIEQDAKSRTLKSKAEHVVKAVKAENRKLGHEKYNPYAVARHATGFKGKFGSRRGKRHRRSNRMMEGY